MTNPASACAKTILFGEHAVVYNEPAIAVPISNTRTYAEIRANGKEFRVISPGTHLNKPFSGLKEGSGLQQLLYFLKAEFNFSELPGDTLMIKSAIPIASGLGSGAALSVAVIRAFSKRYQKDLSTETVNQIAYEVEKIYHGTPSGIDNTVIAYEKPIYYVKNEGFSAIHASIDALHLLVIDSGIRSRTVDVVRDVREHFDRNEKHIREIGALVREAKTAIMAEDHKRIGKLMNDNHRLLQQVNVSCPELDDLTDLARKNGALGAKLTGAGRGGNLIVLARDAENSAALKSLYEKRGLSVIS